MADAKELWLLATVVSNLHIQGPHYQKLVYPAFKKCAYIHTQTQKVGILSVM